MHIRQCDTYAFAQTEGAMLLQRTIYMLHQRCPLVCLSVCLSHLFARCEEDAKRDRRRLVAVKPQSARIRAVFTTDARLHP